MRLADPDPRRAAAPLSSATRPLKARSLAAVLGAVALAGCEAAMPLPDTALLKQQPAPKCETRAAAAAGEGGEAARLKKLDYEVQCYRHAEMIARNRLVRLQNSIKESAKAAAKPSASASASLDNP